MVMSGDNDDADNICAAAGGLGIVPEHTRSWLL